MSKFETLEEVKRHEEALQNARKLMTICHDNFDYPVDALMAMVLGSATLAHGIGMPLPHLLESTDLDQESLDSLAGGKAPRSFPPGFDRVSAVLPEHQAFIVKKWGEATRRKLREI